jgi:PKD domain
MSRLNHKPSLFHALALGHAHTLALLLLTLAMGCHRPESCFEIENETWLVPRIPIQFINCSDNGEEYEWRFGDGADSISFDENPVHTYATQGDYAVNLITTKNNKRSMTTRIIQVRFPLFKEFRILQTPKVKPNGDPWDADGTGADIYFWVTRTYLQPWQGAFSSSFYDNAELPITITPNSDLICAAPQWFFAIYDYDYVLPDVYDTICWRGIQYEDLAAQPVTVFSYCDSAIWEIELKMP